MKDEESEDKDFCDSDSITSEEDHFATANNLRDKELFYSSDNTQIDLVRSVLKFTSSLIRKNSTLSHDTLKRMKIVQETSFSAVNRDATA
eukprot:gene38953-48102_t